MNTSLNLKMKSASDKDMSQAITYIDPNASNADLKGFAQGLVSLTTNTLQSISRIDKTDIDKNYTTVTANRENSVTDGMQITVDGNNVTIAQSEIISKKFDVSSNGESIGTMAIFCLNYTAGTLNITQLVDTQYVIKTKKSPSTFRAITIGRHQDSYDSYDEFYLFWGEEISEIVGFEFNIIVPEGSSGSVNWDTTTFTVKVI